MIQFSSVCNSVMLNALTGSSGQHQNGRLIENSENKTRSINEYEHNDLLASWRLSLSVLPFIAPSFSEAKVHMNECCECDGGKTVSQAHSQAHPAKHHREQVEELKIPGGTLVRSLCEFDSNS